MLAEALCCERVCCLPSIWVSYRGQRFKRSSPPLVDTGCASTRADWRSVGACKCVFVLHLCADAGGVCSDVTLSPCINTQCLPCICIFRQFALLACVLIHSATEPGTSISALFSGSQRNEHVVSGACGTQALISA